MVNIGTRLDDDTRSVLVNELRSNNFNDLAERVMSAPDGLLCNVLSSADFWLLVKLHNEGVISVGGTRRRLKYAFEDRI